MEQYKVQKKLTPYQFNRLSDLLDEVYIMSEDGRVIPVANMPIAKADLIEELNLILNE